MIRWGWAVLVLALALPATAGADPNYDAFDAASFSDGANGLETAYTSAERLQVAAEYNSQNYTLDASELPPTDRTGCGRPGGGFDVGGRSGWVRFLPGVAGTVRYDVGTPAFRSIVQVWTSDTAQRGIVRPNNPPPTFVNVDCNSANTQAGGQYVSVRAVPGKPLWVQTLGYCGTGASADAACPNNRANAVGGPTRVLMTFTPDNDDADPVPDTLDACRGRRRRRRRRLPGQRCRRHLGSRRRLHAHARPGAERVSGDARPDRSTPTVTAWPTASTAARRSPARRTARAARRARRPRPRRAIARSAAASRCSSTT